jgi:hypothetical protein
LAIALSVAALGLLLLAATSATGNDISCDLPDGDSI